jgi:hypothetical protein
MDFLANCFQFTQGSGLGTFPSLARTSSVLPPVTIVILSRQDISCQRNYESWEHSSWDVADR